MSLSDRCDFLCCRTKLTDIDVVILCTGYEIDFPYIDAESTGFQVQNNHVDLYKYVFPPPPKDKQSQKVWPTLSFLGLIQPWGAIMPIAEIQSRWIAQTLTGRVPFFSPLVSSLSIPQRHLFLLAASTALRREDVGGHFK